VDKARRPSGALVASVALAVPTTASARVEAFLHLDGSHGYKIVIGSPLNRDPLSVAQVQGLTHADLPKVRSRQVEVGVFKGRVAAFYSVPGVITAHRIRARIGQFGRVSVKFHRRSTHHLFRLPGCRSAVVERRGSFAGRIRFRGERGYTAIKVARAPGRVDLIHGLHCPGTAPQRGTTQPGDVTLIAKLGETILLAGKTASPRAGFILAATHEVVGRVKIGRIVVGGMRPSAFRVKPDLTSSRLEPRSPFSGAGTFAAPHSWGDSPPVSPGPLTRHSLVPASPQS
jgi:hypothetical protein